MADEQRKQVVHFRQESCGYTAIAKKMGISRDTARSFYRRNGLSGEMGKGRQEAPQQGNCRECGKASSQSDGVKTFTYYGNSRRKYCSHECYARSRFKSGEADG